MSEDLYEVHSLEGQIATAEVEALASLASQVHEGFDIVEIGSYRGKSTCALAVGSSRGARNRVYAVDPHIHYKGPRGGTYGPIDQAALYSNLLKVGVGEIVAVVSLPSLQAARVWQQGNVGLLWIDGDHRYEAVKADLRSWYPSVKEGGIIALHDVDYDDVRRAVAEAVEDQLITELEEVGKGMAVYRKPISINGA